LRLYPIEKGSLLLDNQGIEKYYDYSVREKMGYAPQEYQLFSKTIKDNILFYRENLENNLEQALILSDIKKDIENFKDGINTLVGENGISLSGGQKQRLGIARAILANPDILILDEPTNNLDLKSIEWLEKYLKETQCPIMIVSHDRKFLDDVVTKIIEIDYFTRNLIEYPGNYSEYKKFKQQQEEAKLKRYQEQQEKIGDLKKSINQKKEWAQKGNKQEVSDKDKLARGYLRNRSQTLASNAKKIENQISQMEIMDRPKIKNKLHIEIPNSKKEGNTDVIAKDLVSGYDNGFKTDPINLHIKYGERIVITGDNGSGKSTFLKTLIGEQKQIEGQTYIGNGIKIGYISQDTKEENNESIEEYVKNSLKNLLLKLNLLLI